MSKLLSIIGGITGTTIIATGGTYLLLTQGKEKFKDTFKNALINLETENTLIAEKLTKLKIEASTPQHPKLISAKNKEKGGANKGLEDLKSGCKEIYNSFFTSRESKLFKDFQSFCSKNIKDMMGKDGWYNTDAVWTTRFSKLKKEGTKPSSASLIAIANKDGDGNKGNDLKDWCEKYANFVYESPENLEYKDVKLFCGKNN